MGELLAQLLPEMIGLILTPGAILGCILLLRSQRPAPSAGAFGAGFCLVYVFIAVSALLGGASDPDATTPDVSHGAGLVVGALFLIAAVWLSVRPRRQRAERPKVLRELETAGPRRAFVIGVALGVLNPNLFIMMSGMSIIASSPVGTANASGLYRLRLQRTFRSELRFSAASFRELHCIVRSPIGGMGR
ncbi:GAP family protein [Rhodococcus sp. D-1]|uniref:GAP family protein n=1 Tax=Rhodococcus sp. D-1 TaxID=1912238 RepID=UPI00097598DD|nr:GAP family protein [Rhodococcus sp. D-1]OMQ24341.1 hypothetical protein BK799_31435 [Rhodococcus sp. D-1]